MAEPRSMSRKISAGVILVDARGRVLMQLRDDDPAIMFPGHWGLTGGAGNPGETPEATARREIVEETGLTLGDIEPFRAYYFQETRAAGGARKAASKVRADYELYLFHAPCETPAEEMICGEGRELRFFAPDEFPALDLAYNHREVVSDFFASPAYGRYVRGEAFGSDGEAEAIDPIDHFLAAIDAGDPWFEAMMQAIALWHLPAETVEDRTYRYLIGGEAFDWLLLAERLIAAAGARIPEREAERLLFAGDAPGIDPAAPAASGRVPDELLREAFGESKHRAHLNYLYGVTVEEALQYAVELEVAKERVNVRIDDHRTDDHIADPVYQRIYGEPRGVLLHQFRDEMHLPQAAAIVLSELREFMYWLFKYRVSNQEPARVASDTRKALAQLSAMEAAVRRARTQPRAGEPSPSEAFEPAG